MSVFIKKYVVGQGEVLEELTGDDLVKYNSDSEQHDQYVQANQYKWDRLNGTPDEEGIVSGGYPPIGDQLDDLFKAGAFSDEMTATIQAVKDKYPKE